eukprot:CAMPEP_0196579116 /NCGR_PEP_ID=MMETSP1081-20130531/17657_1 /TAXON_ID=36882 /ORGANISM="Pyramimonas amylifera, Strain CCMP720" /LENGTH=245 /DNA_ID=CAMNT_0041898581 /DNA_START=148 /DNA_END=885 /DNA_ORIENTATION=+
MTHASVEASIRSSLACTSTSFRAASPKSSLVTLQNKSFFGNSQQLTLNKKSTCSKVCTPLKVEALVSRETKEETVQKLAEQLDKTFLLASMTYQGVSVATLKKFRRSLPADAQFIVSKNTLMKRAVGGTTFEEFGKELTGPNGFLMVGEDGMKDALKACSELSKSTKKANKESNVGLTKGLLDGTMFSEADLKKLEDLPSKQELLTKIACAIQAVPTKVALSVKAVPRKVGYAAKALKDKLDQEA